MQEKYLESGPGLNFTNNVEFYSDIFEKIAHN
jgi:hypothetical protein